MADPAEVIEDENEGAFLASLKRNNKKIREDRAKDIVEGTQLSYKRKVEDMRIEVKKLVRERESLIDISTVSSAGVILPSDFDSGVFVNKDIEIGVKIWNLTQKIEIAEARYFVLFGEKI